MANTGISDFSRRFSAALQGFMREYRVRVEDVAAISGRSKGFVSQHTSGKAAPDTDLLDAVAEVANMTTEHLVREIVRRMEPAVGRGHGVGRAIRPDATPDEILDAVDDELEERRNARQTGMSEDPASVRRVAKRSREEAGASEFDD